MDADAVKVAFTDADGEVETLWAKRVAGGRFALDNLPWFAYGVSLGDVVEAEADEKGMLNFTRVIEKSGNRTIRVMPDVSEPGGAWTFESRQLMDTLVERGCSFEGATPAFVAVNIPPAVQLDEVAALLVDSGFDWEYADPPYEDLFPDAAPDDDAGA